MAHNNDPSRFPRRGKYPRDRTREVFEAAWSGNAVFLNEVLREMNRSERASALETKTPMHFSRLKDACDSNKITPLIAAVENGNLDCVKVLLKHKADIEDRDTTGQTALHYAVRQDCKSCDVLSHLIKNGADVNARTNENCTPLIKAISTSCGMNVVTFLIEHGADLNTQDKYGDTALHYAVIANSSDAVKKLLTLGACQLCDSRWLTPLLLASALCRVSIVHILINRANCTKKQRIDALELLGASLSVERCTLDHSQDIWEGFEYMKHGMEKRFADPSHPLLKQPLEPVEAYQNRNESRTLEELAQIEGDMTAILMESLIIRERILGRNNIALLGPIRSVADYYSEEIDISISIGLYRHAMKISQSCNQSAISDLDKLTCLLYEKVWSHVPPRLQDLLELLEQTVLEYEKQQIFTRGIDSESHEYQFQPLRGFELHNLFDCAKKIVQIIAKFKHCKEGKSSSVSVMLQRLSQLLPRDNEGETLLHKAVGHHNTDAFLCLDTVKLLLNAGFSVNAVNNNGETPLHRAVTFQPSKDEIHLFIDMLEVLLDGGAHHDFVTSYGKTAMDIAQTYEARRILSKKRKLELKCISARAVKKFGLRYLGMVPKPLEKYISMH